jgi:arylsulfatase A-like enzyme
MIEEYAFFEQVFLICVLCSSYRALLISGQYSHKNDMVDNKYKSKDDQVTMHQALKESDYRTAFIGKCHLDYSPFPENKWYGLDYIFANKCNHHH